MLRIRRDRAPIGAWLDKLDARAHKNVVVALANKLYRFAWAVLSTGNDYRATPCQPEQVRKDAFGLETLRVPTFPHHDDESIKFPPRSAEDSKDGRTVTMACLRA